MPIAQALVGVPVQVDDDDVAARFERSMRFGQGHCGIGEVVQDHTGDDGVDFAVGHRQVLEIAQTKIAAPGVAVDRAPRQIQHGIRGVDGDNLLRPFQQRGDQQSRPAAHIEGHLAALR